MAINHNSEINWLEHIDAFGLRFLEYIGYGGNDIVDLVRYERVNPLIRLLKNDPALVVKASMACNSRAKFAAPSLDGVSRLAIIMQMMLYDRVNGPEQDGKPKALRRHWYAYFKQFAQLYAVAIDPNIDFDDPNFNISWSGRQSKLYGELVDTGEVTYKDLWIEDASRMMQVDPYSNLIPGLPIFVFVEKDSLFSDFVSASRALGASGILSGKGKNSKAAMELMLRKLNWSKDWNPFEGKPVVFMHLSDHDFDGEAVIGPTFAEQARRYLDNVHEVRIGVKPEQVDEETGDAWDASYVVKLSNEGYKEWASKKALFWGRCNDCGEADWVIGRDEDGYSPTPCRHCGADAMIVDQDSFDDAHGFEVESLKSADYYRAMVKALLSKVPFETLLKALRTQCVPSNYSVSRLLTAEHLEDNNDHYQRIGNVIDLLVKKKEDLEEKAAEAVQSLIEDIIDQTKDEWMDLEDDPEPETFENYVVSAGRSGYGSPWRPFSESVRNEFIKQRIEEENPDIVERIQQFKLDMREIMNDIETELEE